MRRLIPQLRSWLVAAALIASGAAQAQQDPNPFDRGPDVKGPAPLTKETKAEILKELSDVITTHAFVPGMDLTKWPDYLAHERVEIDVADEDYAFARGVNVAMRDFGVSHILFLPPKAALERRRTTAIGVGLSAVSHSDGIVINTVLPKTSAEAADLHEGDRILDIDGKHPTSEALQGGLDTEIQMKVQPTDGPVRTVRLKRTLFSTTPPSTLSMEDGVAVLKIWSFDRGYDPDKVEELVGEAAKAKYLILDLRSNGGGNMDNAMHLLSLLLPPDTPIGTFIFKTDLAGYFKSHPETVRADPVAVAKGIKDKYRTQKIAASPFPGKIAVVVNRGSASSSEIVAEALRETIGASIVGTQSAGAVLASVFRRLPYGFEVQYPISDYVSQGSVRLERNPILPDVEVKEAPTHGHDPAVTAAIERLRAAGL